MNVRKGDYIHGFDIVSLEDFEELRGVGVFARHRVTGLELFHIVNDDEENLFAYAFATPPADSTGVAHIIEHSVLCGSRNYPLKDPFLVLAKQSVKTFLNAMTFPDKTVYPASSMVEADYFNLMSVYGDAVFFPLLEEWTFRQEGHRFERDAEGHVSIQGVVFNEMRGNYSSFDNVAGDWSLKSLLGGTVYEHDSGGDPADIPALTYEQFKAFHAKWYHPSNCRVFLCGNIPTERQLELLDRRFLSSFKAREREEFRSTVAPFDRPRILEVPAPAGEGQDKTLATVQLNWLLPDSTDTVALMEANLVAEILLGHDGAPLSRALLESGLGEDVAPSSGLETEIRHMCFSVGLRGVNRDRADAVERLVRETLEALVEGGIPAEDIETAVRSIDFGNREIRRSGGPFALTLMRRSLRGWIHGFGPEATLRYIPAFETVKRRISEDPEYLVRLLRNWFLDNGNRSRVTVYPDPDYEKRLEDSLSLRVKTFESGLTAEGREAFANAQAAFFSKQAEIDDPERLALIPHLSRKDLPLVADSIETVMEKAGNIPVFAHEQATNGIAYLDFAIPVDVLMPEDYPYLPLFSSALTGMGLDGLSWAETSALTARITGGFGSTLFTSSTVPGYTPPAGVDPLTVGRDWLILRVKALGELSGEAIDLAFRFLESADFSDTKRLIDLVREYRNDLDSSIAPAGNQYAVSRAAAGTGRIKAVDELWNGLSQIAFMRSLASEIGKKGRAGDLSTRLEGIKKRLLESGLAINLTGTRDLLDSMLAAIGRRGSAWKGPVAASPSVSGIEPFRSLAFKGLREAPFIELITAPIQVGFAAAVLPSPPYGTEEHPVDIVFGHWFASDHLWEKIRMKGGAYGAFSYPDSLEDIFVLASYRDPDPLKSLEVFKEALADAAANPPDALALDKTVTGCYSREVQPRSPSDKGFTAFVRVLYGITDEVRRAKIARILSVTPEDIRRRAESLLSAWPVSAQTALAGKKQLQGYEDFAGIASRFTI